MPAAAWARPFDDPVLLPGGRKLVTLRDAADYIMKTSEGRTKSSSVADHGRGADHGRRRSRTADARAHRCAEGSHRNVERVFNPSRKDTHWGKHKLKREE